MIAISAQTKDFSGPARLPEAVYNVRRYAHHVLGGPKTANIDVNGTKENLWELFKHLRTPITLHNEEQDKTWWGFIAEVKVTLGPIVFVRSIDGMRNSIIIRYSTADGLEVGRTDPASDSDSIAEYGTRELVDSMPSSTLAQAINYRDTLLAIRKDPQLTWDGGTGTATSATLACRGWWSTTDWLYYQAAESEQSNEATVNAQSSFGWTYHSTLLAFESVQRRIYSFDSQSISQVSGLGQLAAGEQFFVTAVAGTPGVNNNTAFTVEAADNSFAGIQRDDLSFGVNPSNPAQGAIASPFSVFYAFQAGDMIKVTNSTSNDGYYKVASRAVDGTALYLTTLVTVTGAHAATVVIRGPYVTVSGTVLDELPAGGKNLYLQGRNSSAQSFSLTGVSSITAGQIRLQLLGTASAPLQTISLYLCDDASGEPGTILGTATVSSSEVPTGTFDWVTFQFSPGIALTSGVPYWLAMERTAVGIDRAGQFWLGLDSGATYAGGTAAMSELWSGGAGWQDLAADAPFRLTGDVQTTEVAELIINGYGQFFTDVQVLDGSGVISQQRRNGNQTARQEIESLLAQGTTANKPLYASVDINRVVRIFEEPARPADLLLWRLHADGALTTAAGARIPASRCPVGCWVKLHNIIPPSVDLPGITDPSVAFIEEAEYEVGQDRWIPHARGGDSKWAIAGLRRG